MRTSEINNANLFHVGMLGGSLNRHTFASFKITTLNYDIYNIILNEINWNPQSARIFYHRTPIRTNRRVVTMNSFCSNKNCKSLFASMDQPFHHQYKKKLNPHPARSDFNHNFTPTYIGNSTNDTNYER